MTKLTSLDSTSEDEDREAVPVGGECTDVGVRRRRGGIGDLAGGKHPARRRAASRPEAERHTGHPVRRAGDSAAACPAQAPPVETIQEPVPVVQQAPRTVYVTPAPQAPPPVVALAPVVAPALFPPRLSRRRWLQWRFAAPAPPAVIPVPVFIPPVSVVPPQLLPPILRPRPVAVRASLPPRIAEFAKSVAPSSPPTAQMPTESAPLQTQAPPQTQAPTQVPQTQVPQTQVPRLRFHRLRFHRPRLRAHRRPLCRSRRRAVRRGPVVGVLVVRAPSSSSGSSSSNTLWLLFGGG